MKPGEPSADPDFRPGFILSIRDRVVLVIGGAGACLLWHVEWWMALVVGFAVGHFFLFCNVFRVARDLEITWAVIFVALAGCSIRLGVPGWTTTILLTLGVTAVVLCLQFRRPSYHGVGWQRINPQLPVWWENQRVSETAAVSPPAR